MNRIPLVVGNWKMNGTRASAQVLLREVSAGLDPFRHLDVAVCVPFPYLETTVRELNATRLAWGAQSVSEFDAGAHTGEVSAGMLRDFGCSYVLIGHSERRMANGETDVIVPLKTTAALRAGITPIICVGESLAERKSGATTEVVLKQLDAAINGLDHAHLRSCVVAYEPVWAIGTGLTATPQQAEDVHEAIRRRIASVDASAAAALRILYGGSVKPSSAAELFSQPNIDGGLIGGASLVAADFLAIAASADQHLGK